VIPTDIKKEATGKANVQFVVRFGFVDLRGKEVYLIFRQPSDRLANAPHLRDRVFCPDSEWDQKTGKYDEKLIRQKRKTPKVLRL